MNQVEKDQDQDKKPLIDIIIAKTSFYWLKIVDYYQLIKLVRFSVFIALLAIAFILVPQGEEAIIAMMENANDANKTQLFIFIFSNFALALMCWYYARTLYLFAFDHQGIHQCEHEKFTEHFPRWLGFSLVFIPALITLSMQVDNNSLFIPMLISSVIFLFIVYKRRKVFRLKKICDTKLKSDRFMDLPRHTRFILIGFILLNWLLLYLFTSYGQDISVHIGTTAVVMLALATLVSVGSTITFLGERKRIPLLFIIFVIAVLTSMVSDNHKIRSLEGQPPFVSEETTIKQHFTKWLAKRRVGNSNKNIPVIFIAAEGGGIRAAYWTAIVLGHLQDTNPKFAQHVYAISGVSGGSLGASVFNALLTQDDLMDKCLEKSNCGKENNNYFNRSKRILKEDFLAPTIASMMFPDAFQRFCFFCRFDDRAQALEKSWEEAWDKEWQDNPSSKGVFDKPFQDLWSNDYQMKIPQLFLNSTVVETGQRIIATALDLGENFDKTFHDALATFTVTKKPLRLSTTVHTSARFTYVSPAGSLLREDKPHSGKWIRLVDGGYFENSGATAIIEILNEILVLDSSKNIQPIVIHISNEPDYPEKNDYGKDSQAQFLSEILSPAYAIFHVREGKGHQARIALEQIILDINEKVEKERAEIGINSNEKTAIYKHIGLEKTCDVKLPLGWMLSSRAQKNMDAQLKGHKESINYIDKQLNSLIEE